MLETNPIIQIEGAFENYKDNETVTASEYNANTQLFKKAIEHNGAILKTHQDAIKELAAGNIPEEGVGPDQIADQAISKDKLAPELINEYLLTPAAVASYFKDYLVQVHKHTPDIKGVFMNGSVKTLNAKLQKALNFQNRTVTCYDADMLIWDDTTESRIRVPIPNANLCSDNPFGFAFSRGSTRRAEIYEATCMFKISYDYTESPVNICYGDRYSFKYTVCAHYNANPGRRIASIEPALKIHTLDGSTIDVSNLYVGTTKHRSDDNASKMYTFEIEYTPPETFNAISDITKVELYLKYTLEYSVSDGGPEAVFNDVCYAKEASLATFEESLYTGSSADYCRQQAFAPSIANTSFVHLSYRIFDLKDATRELDLTQYPIKTNVLGTCISNETQDLLNTPNPVGTEAYIPCSKGALDTYTVTRQSDNAYFIEQTFTAPWYITFEVSDTVIFKTLNKRVKKGSYRLWYNPYIVQQDYMSYIDVQECVTLLKNDCDTPENIINIKIQQYALGTNGVSYSVATTYSDLEIKDVCVVRY